MSRRVAVVALMAAFASVGVAAAGEPTVLRVGEAPPKLEFVDIRGERIDSQEYRGWVQVLTFADRKSSEGIKSWMRDAQVRATQAHPELPVAYFSFADLSAVPRLMRGMVRPLLRRSFEKSNQELAESYREVGIESAADKVAFRFIPDWDGSYLEAFGLENAAIYHCWVAVDGRVVAAFDASTPDIADRYVDVFDRLDPETKSQGEQP